MKEGGKQFTDNTAKNCGFNCFMGSKQEIKPHQSQSLWLKFRRRKNHDGKSMKEYAVKISPAGKETEKSEAFVLSFSRGGEVIPVKILSPVRKEENAQKISGKRRTKEGKAGRRSWVRMAIRAFRFSTKKNPNGKVIQDPPPAGDSEIVPVQPSASADSNLRPVEQPSEVLNSDPRDSSPRSVEKTCAIPVINRKTRVIDRVQGHITAPSSPMKGTSPASSYSNLPRTPPRLIKVHRLVSTVLDPEVALQNPGHSKFQGCDAAIVFSAVIIILFCLVISDKLFAIVCTSIWWYAVPKLRSIRRAEEPQKDPEVKKLLIKSLSNNNIDLQSSEYRKKVIMEGILQRNHKLT